jgi:hypothetical protein
MRRYEEALYATDHILALIKASYYPQDEQDIFTLRRNRAQCLQYTGRRDEAIATYRSVGLFLCNLREKSYLTVIFLKYY